MTHSPMFGAQIATRSPRSMPLAMKARAASSAASASSANVEAPLAVDQTLEGTELGGGPLDDGGDGAGVEVDLLDRLVCHAPGPPACGRLLRRHLTPRQIIGPGGPRNPPVTVGSQTGNLRSVDSRA